VFKDQLYISYIYCLIVYFGATILEQIHTVSL